MIKFFQSNTRRHNGTITQDLTLHQNYLIHFLRNSYIVMFNNSQALRCKTGIDYHIIIIILLTDIGIDASFQAN